MNGKDIVCSEMNQNIFCKFDDEHGLRVYASAFNQPIGNWNNASVTGRLMFQDTSFDKDISNWNTERVTTTSKQCSSMSQPSIKTFLIGILLVLTLCGPCSMVQLPSINPLAIEILQVLLT